MLSKNWSNDARIGFLLTTWVMKDFFIVEDRMFDNYEDELIKASLFQDVTQYCASYGYCLLGGLPTSYSLMLVIF
jgi:hypothetical protein